MVDSSGAGGKARPTLTGTSRTTPFSETVSSTSTRRAARRASTMKLGGSPSAWSRSSPHLTAASSIPRPITKRCWCATVRATTERCLPPTRRRHSCWRASRRTKGGRTGALRQRERCRRGVPQWDGSPGPSRRASLRWTSCAKARANWRSSVTRKMPDWTRCDGKSPGTFSPIVSLPTAIQPRASRRTHCLRARSSVQGRSALYVCHNFSCQAPVTQAQQVREALGIPGA